MKKAKLLTLISMASVGLCSGLALSNSPTLVRAEDEASSVIEFSNSDEMSSFETISTEDTEIASEEGKIEQLEKELEAKIAEFQKTRAYSIIVEIVALAYVLWGVLDKILNKTTLSKAKDQIFENASTLVKTQELGDRLKSVAEDVKADYEKCELELADTKAALVGTTEALEKSLADVAELSKQVALLSKALLEVCKGSAELVESGTYKKVESVINGASNDGE